MRCFYFLLFVAIFLSAGSCKSDKSQPVFCDTACNNDTLRFSKLHPLSPKVLISVKNCIADTIIWSHDKLENNRKMSFDKEMRLNKNFARAYFNDTSYAWLEFNDCITGRGYLMKLPFNKAATMSNYSSALTSFDPKFHIEEGLISYFDNLFIYVQDVMTGKIEKMKLNDTRLEIDFDKIHKTFDSVNVSRSRIFANVNINGKTVPLSKEINLNP